MGNVTSKKMEIILNGKKIDPNDLSETLRLLSCEIPSLAYRRPTYCHCLTCGESRKFSDPMTACEFVNRHKRQGCKKVEIIVTQITKA